MNLRADSLSFLDSRELFLDQIESIRLAGNTFRQQKLIEKYLTTDPVVRSSISESIHSIEKLKKKGFPLPFWFISQQHTEMGTAWPVAQFHASLLRSVSQTVYDLTAGGGLDSFAFLQEGLSVFASDSDPQVITRLKWNRQLWNFQNFHPEQTDGLSVKPQPGSSVFADPMRRRGNKRNDIYLPDPKHILELFNNDFPVLLKLSPLENPDFWNEKGLSVIVVSVQRECREVLIANKFFLHQPLRSVWIDGRHFPPFEIHDNLDATEKMASRHLYIPDPALLVSGLHRDAAMTFNLEKVDEEIPLYSGYFKSVERLFDRYLIIDDQIHTVSEISAVYRKKYFPRPLVVKKFFSSVNVDRIRSEVGVKDTDFQLRPIIALVVEIQRVNRVFWCSFEN